MDINRFSCCSIAMHSQPPEYVFRVVAEAGYKKIDLLGRAPHFDLNDPNYNFPKVVETATKYGIRIANIGSYCGGDFVSEDVEKRELALKETKAVLDAAAFCGARSIRTRPGSPEDPALIDRMVPYYKQAAEYAERKGVYMGIENHGGAISGNPEACAELFSKVGSKYAGVLYEPCNLELAGVNYKQAFSVMKDYITHVHMKDCYEIDGKMRSVWLGTGGIDYRWVFAQMEGIGYKGDYALEYELDVEPAEKALPKWLDWALKL